MRTCEPNLEATMEHLNLNQAQLGELLGVTYGAISRWLAGNRPISETARRLLVVLNNGKNKEALAALDRYDPVSATARTTKKKLGRPRKQ